VTSVVLDASAVIAVLNSEPGAEVVLGSMAHAFISAVNYSEVIKKTVERLQERTPIRALLRSYWIEIVPFDETLATVAGELFGPTKQHGLSFADRACLALGLQRKCKVLTSEGRMGLVKLPIKVKLIRNAH
jgi:PIN domain nuclease of toxin-antitoxin system